MASTCILAEWFYLFCVTYKVDIGQKGWMKLAESYNY